MKIRKYVQTTKRKVFLEFFYVCAYASIFGLMSMISVSYSNEELTKAKRAGGFLGFLFSLVALGLFVASIALFKGSSNGLTYAICCGIGVFIVYTVFLILFGIKYKVK